MPASIRQRLHRLSQAVSRNETRKLELVTASGETVLSAGAAAAQSPHRVQLADGQVPFVRWFAEQLRSNLPPERAVIIDDRRGGKTWAGLLCLVAAVIDQPRQQAYIVSHSGQRDAEIDDFFTNYVPASWFEKTAGATPEYAFASSQIINVTTRKLDAVPASGACLFVNDYSMLKERELDALMEFDGMVIVAGNAPIEPKERWFEKYQASIRAGKLKGFRMPPRENQFINQDASAQIDELIESIRPGSAGAVDRFWALERRTGA